MMPFRALGSTGYDVHVMGFGSYRVNEGNLQHETALRTYLDLGGNLIDTSANYGDGLSELLIGRVIRDYPRDKVVLITKGGYIQGQNMELAREHEFPETVRYSNTLWHCLHPGFLETQVERSLQRMGQTHCDVYLLHNPEYYLNYLAHSSPITDAALHEFYRRIKHAFDYLESQVAAGRIRYYGISSNNFGFHEKDRARVSVAHCLDMARRLSSDHHFRVIQLPMNLYEAGGAIFETNDGKTILQYCRDEKLGVLINRPLNAFFRNRLIRLADFVPHGKSRPAEAELDEMLRPLRESEASFQSLFDLYLFGEEKEGLAAYLKKIAMELPSRDHWEGVMERFIVPPLTVWLRHAHASLEDNPQWDPWRNDFVLKINQALELIERFVSASSQSTSDRVRQLLYDSGYPVSTQSLSRIALSMVAQLDGVTSVLNGMRTPEYVADAMGAPALPDVDAPAILGRFQDRLDAMEKSDDDEA